MLGEQHKEDADAPIGNYYLYVEKSDKVDIHIGSERSSVIQVKDTASIAKTLSIIIPPVYLSEYENLGNTACHIEKTDKVK